MTTISFITQDGTVKSGQASSGSLMELAVRLGVAGIEGQCGGSMSCGTCHVRLPEDWASRLVPASPIEADLLEFEEGYSPQSRLSCQIPISPEIDGLTVTVMRK